MASIDVNITKHIDCFTDPITLDEYSGTIEDYIKMSTDNIVILHSNNLFFLTRRSMILEQYAKRINQYHGCRYRYETRLGKYDPHIDHSAIYFSMRSIGFIHHGNYCDISEIENNGGLQLFALYELRRAYPSYAYAIGTTEIHEYLVKMEPDRYVTTAKMLPGRPSTSDNLVPLLQPGTSEPIFLYDKHETTSIFFLLAKLYMFFHGGYMLFHMIFNAIPNRDNELCDLLELSDFENMTDLIDLDGL